MEIVSFIGHISSLIFWLVYTTSILIILPTAVEYEALRLNSQEIRNKKLVDFHYAPSLHKFI